MKHRSTFIVVAASAADRRLYRGTHGALCLRVGADIAVLLGGGADAIVLPQGGLVWRY